MSVIFANYRGVYKQYRLIEPSDQSIEVKITNFAGEILQVLSFNRMQLLNPSNLFFHTPKEQIIWLIKKVYILHPILNSLPSEIYMHVFQALITKEITASLQQLKNCTLVCKRWKELIGIPKLRQPIVHTLTSFIPKIAFGKTKWEKYFGDVGTEPVLPGNVALVVSGCISAMTAMITT